MTGTPAAHPGSAADRLTRISVWVVVAAGIVLLAWQYLSNSSLWLDELAVAQNVLERSWSELLARPLSYYQIAPVGFLTLEKAATSALGDSNWALRLVPLLAAVAALVLFAVVALRALPPRAAVVSVSMLAFSGRLVWNGSQSKQYASDVLATVLLLWAIQRWLGDRSARRTVEAIAIGVAVALLSQPAAFVLAGGASVAMLDAWHHRGETSARRAIALAASWVAAAGIGTLINRTLAAPETLAMMRDFWSEGFAPFPPVTLHAVAWPFRILRDVFGSTLALRGGVFYVTVAAVGGLVFLTRLPFGAVVLVPILAAYVASAARQYPFIDRVVVFAVPLLALACAVGVERFALLVAWRRAWLATAWCAGVAVAPVAAIVRQPPPYPVQNIEPVLRTMASAYQPGDAIYLYYGAAPGVARYAPKVGLPLAGAIWGECHRGNPRQYLREVDALRGRPRAWIVFSHAERRFGERYTLLQYLDSIGTERFTASFPTPYVASVTSVDVHLFDLSDPQRLAHVDAERMPVAKAWERPDWLTQCRQPFGAGRPDSARSRSG